MTIADIIFPGNSLCLCGKCNSIIKGGGDFEASFLEEIEGVENVQEFIEKFNGSTIESVPDIFRDHIDFDDMFSLPIRLNKVKENIYFTEEHLTQFFAFLTVGINNE